MKHLLEDPFMRCFQVLLLAWLAMFNLNYFMDTIYQQIKPPYQICELPNGAGFVEWRGGKQDFYPKDGGGIEWNPLGKMRKKLEDEG